MKPRQTELTPELLKYIEENFNAEDSFLKQLAANCWAEQGIPQINITGYQANFLQFLIKLTNPKNILEIGTLAGYSAIAMAKAASENAKILTIEKSKSHFDYAVQKVKEANLSHKITIVNENAKTFLQSYMPENKIDLVFVDADKQNYMNYFNLIDPHLKQGGLLVFDNAFAFGFLLDSAPERNEDNTKSLVKFQQKVLERKDYFTTIVPIGDGMLLSVKLPE